jgi:hypothetical protein
MRTQNNRARTDASLQDFLAAVLNLVLFILTHLLRRAANDAAEPRQRRRCEGDSALHDEAYQDMRKLQTQLFQDMMQTQQEMYEDLMRVKREQVTSEDYNEINERMRSFFNSNNTNKRNTP